MGTFLIAQKVAKRAMIQIFITMKASIV